MKKILLTAVLLSFSSYLLAQEWVDKMMDPNVNFYEVQESFNEHWGEKGYERGKGWKQYKRWEHHVGARTYPTGERNHSKTYYEAWKQIQKMNKTEAKSTSEWQPVGPTSWNESPGWNPGLGRINAIIEDPNDANILYVTTPAGGLWKSENAGTDWTPLTDHLPAIGASGLAIDPNNSDILYLATGDGNGGDTYSFGVLKSIDGGVNWEPTSLVHNIANGVRCTAILMDPTNSQKLWVTSTAGLYVTTNGGISWIQSLTGSIRDLAIKPGDPSVVYCSGNRFYKSTDGGMSFTEITTGTPSPGNVNRLAITVSEDDPSMVYFVAGSSEDSGFYGFYRSNDSGDSFQLQSDSPNILTYSEIGNGEGGQSWYDLAIVASPTNANVVYVGGINVWRSNNGGVTWEILSHWVYPSAYGYTHADIHVLEIFGNKLYCGSDGGIFVSTNSGNQWTDLSDGLQISQYYRISASTTDPNLILTASQDNGTNLFVSPGTYNHLLGGDGNMALIDYSNDDIMYSAYPGGSFQRSTNGGVSFQDFTNGIDETGAWVAPLEIHPTNPNILFAGLENVWKTTGNGVWSPISSIGFSGNLQALKVAPSDPDVIYASSTSTLRKTEDGGSNWSTISAALPNLTITGIEVHPTNPDEIWVTMSGYDADSKVFYSENGGTSWENITLNLPNIPVNCVAYQIGSNDGIYVGTDAGVYYKDANNVNWSSYNNGLPNVIINQIIFHYQSGKVLLATYGRGVWENEFFDPSSVMPVVNFSANKDLICMGETIDFLNLSLNISDSVYWTFEGGTPEVSTEISPTVTYTEGGIFSAKLVASNANGTDSLLIENLITVLDTEGTPAPYSENFEEAATMADVLWYVDNEDGLQGWKINHDIGYQSDKSVWINNFDNLPQQFDRLNSATFDLSEMDTALVTMRVAYARRPSSSLESLRVSISNDCGATWTFKKTFNSSSILQSADPTSDAFVPTDESDWNLFVIDNIQPHERTENFRIQLQFLSNGGNNIYVDDINIIASNPVSVEDKKSVFERLSVYPNPSTDFTTVSLTARIADDASIELIDIQGKSIRPVWFGRINEGENSIQLSLKGISPGIYTLSVKTKHGDQNIQLFVAGDGK